MEARGEWVSVDCGKGYFERMIACLVFEVYIFRWSHQFYIQYEL